MSRQHRREQPGSPVKPMAAFIEKVKEAQTVKPYAPPVGFPADTPAFLAYLEAGVFTPEQVKYLQSNALSIYEAGVNAARALTEGNPEMQGAVEMGDKIIAAWKAWLELNPAPASTFSPMFTPPQG